MTEHVTKPFRPMWIGKLDEGVNLGWLPEDIKELRPLITGRAIHPVKTEHPKEWPEVRVYLEEELRRAADGWVGTVPTFEHAWEIDGWKVVATSYSDGELKYAIQPIYDKVLESVRNGKIKHVSIGFDWMVPGGGLKFVDGIAPYGFEAVDIALLEKLPPGDLTSTVHLWESVAQKMKEQVPNCPLCGKPMLQKSVKTIDGVNVLCCSRCGQTVLGEQSLQGTEQTPPKPRKTEVGPPEAVIGKRIEEIEAEMVLIRAQMAGLFETLKTLGYDLSRIKQVAAEVRG